MRAFSQCLVFCSALAVLVGCQPASKPAEETKPEVTLTVTQPTLEPQEGYPWQQAKDNVTMVIAPGAIEARPVYQRSLKKKFELFKAAGSGDLYQVTDQPARLELESDHLVFSLTITNNLSHVLRLHGAVPTLSVDGKTVPIDSRTQEELVRAVLTPYTSLSLSIDGPQLSALERASTVTLAIFDVITAVDEANNPTKRTTFEWVFGVRPVTVTQTVAVRVAEERFSEAQASREQNRFVP